MNAILSFWIFIYYWLSVIFYDYISIRYNLQFIDELMVLILSIFLTYEIFRKAKINKNLIIFLLLISFYFIHSIIINITNFNAIINDSIVISKSFITLIGFSFLNPKFSKKQINFLKTNAILGSLLIAVFILIGEEYYIYFFQHHSRLATSAALTALFYILCSTLLNNYSLQLSHIIIFLLILSLSIASNKAKAYSFFIPSIFLCLYFYIYRNKTNPMVKHKIIIPILIASLISLYISSEKIIFYLVEGTQNYEMFARPALYTKSLNIAKDYFPFGTGLASFGSYYSGVYYSEIYSQYGLDKIWGLSPANPWFISDTFFPMLIGQFGIFGFFCFIYTSTRTYIIFTNMCKNRIHTNSALLLFHLLLTFCIIESIADSTIVQNRGVFAFSMLSITYSYVRNTYFIKN